jgi:hypothetical protein
MTGTSSWMKSFSTAVNDPPTLSVATSATAVHDRGPPLTGMSMSDMGL